MFLRGCPTGDAIANMWFQRSVSPSKFESRASGSPTKLSVPNRKQRNQPVNRIHDIEFAAEISTSLIQQVRHLQALLSEREEELKDTKAENSRLEIEYEAFQQRVKALDESEHKYKDENWNLETQIHDLLAAQKESADREKKLTQALNAVQADKNSTQRELDEVKLNFSKLDEKHAAAIKQHDIDLGTAKRKEVLADSERAALHRKVEDLTSQNQELAQAFSLQRGRALEREAALGMTDEELDAANDAGTPDHSPPPSPVKGTPRHPALESETLKTSLLHSQRTIQSLRANIHREKTEKLDLRRMLQDARDELEKARSDPNAAHRRSRKVESKEFKKPLKPGQLGGPRSSRSEISFDDPEWEDQGLDAGSSRSPVASTSRSSAVIAPIAESGTDEQFLTAAESTDANFETAAELSDGAAFETAAETDAAFETAHGGTETEDFHTGAEEFSDDDEATETEASPSRGAGMLKRPPVLPYGLNRYSFESTASNSGDDDYSYNNPELKTPTALQPQRMKVRVMSRSGFNLAGRGSRVASEEPNFNSSPAGASFTRSASGTPQAPGQSLFAELNEFEGSDDESYNGGGMTPSRRSTRSFTPASTRGWTATPPPAVPALPKVVMVTQGTMTDPVSVAPELPLLSPQSVVFNERPTSSVGSVIGPQMSHSSTQWLGDEWHDQERSRPISTFSYSDSGIQYDPDMDAKLAQFPSPPSSAQHLGQTPIPILPPPQALSASYIHTEHVQPEAESVSRPSTPVALGMSSTLTEHVEPVEHCVEVPTPPRLGVSSVLVSMDDEPIMLAKSLPAPASFAEMQAVEVQPQEEKIEPELAPVLAPVPVPVPVPVHAPVSLSIVAVQAEEVHPQEEPKPTLPPLTFAIGQAEEVHPQEEPKPAVPSLAFAIGQAEEVRPQEAPAPLPVALSAVSVQAEEVQPREEPRPALSIAPPQSLEVQPIHEPVPLAATLSQAEILALAVEPISSPPRQKESPVLGLSTVETLDTEPVEPEAVTLPLGFSSMQYLDSEPVGDSPRSPKRDAFIIPRDNDMSRPEQQDAPRTPLNAIFGSFQTRNKGKAKGSPETPVIAEDETRQSLNASPVAETPESQRPLKERSSNTDARPARKQSVPTSDSGAQTSLTADAIDEMLKAAKPKPTLAPFVVPSGPPPFAHGHEIKDPFVATPEPSAGKRRSQDSGFDTVVRSKARAVDAESIPDSPATAKRVTTPMPLVRRPSTSSSNYEPSPPPPLPPNHKEVIEAARLGSSGSGQVSPTGSQGLSRLGSSGGAQDLPPLSPTRRGSMGPPPLPVKQSMESSRLGSSSGGQGTIAMGPPALPSHSRSRGYRPGTPKQSSASVASGRGTPTPRAGRGDMYPPPSRGTTTQLSHKSSMSSFVSELDNRFDMHNDMAIGTSGVFGARNPTDPRMIRAITQVMIGEYLWKYTRKAGREEMSDNRHRRYFWLHPYNRTLYWSETDPGDSRRAEVKSKSLAVQAVRMVADTNPMPPGLHNKSLLVIAGKRTIKFTAPTGQRHEIWFNALSFILKKPGDDEEVLDELADGITQEDANEFNPGYSARAVNGTRAMASPSVASYNSRATHSQSPAFDMSMNVPTLTPQTRHKTSQSRLSTIWGTIRSRSVNGHRPSLYDANSETQFEANDSAEDLRAMIEQQDRESDRLENVRACCDGKFIPACQFGRSCSCLLFTQENMTSGDFTP
jgi:hypothetical protein